MTQTMRHTEHPSTAEDVTRPDYWSDGGSKRLSSIKIVSSW